jgi:hypothetical protein
MQLHANACNARQKYFLTKRSFDPIWEGAIILTTLEPTLL